MRKTVSLLLAALLLQFASPALAADTSLRLITSPLPVALRVEPGKSVQTILRVQNGGSALEHIKVGVLKFKAYKDTGQPQLMDPEKGDDFLNWAHFSESTFALDANEWKNVTVTFDVPSTAALGYYYAITFSRDGVATVDTTKQQLNGSTAVLILLDVLVPGAVRRAEIASFSTDHSFYEFLPTTFNVTLHNTGNVFVAPRGNIFLEKNGQKDLGILEVNPEQGNILPDSNRAFTAPWNDGFPHYEDLVQDGKVAHQTNGDVQVTLKWNFADASKLRMGHYTATLVMSYDDGTKDVPLEAKVSFWVIPWRLLVGLGLALALILVGLWSIVRRVRSAVQKRKA